MIVGAAEELIISVITQPCLLIPGISRHRNKGDVVLVLQETLLGIWRVENTVCPKMLLVIVSAVLRMGIWGKAREVLAAALGEKRTERSRRGDNTGICAMHAHAHMQEMRAGNTDTCMGSLSVSLSFSRVQSWESRVVGELTCLPAHKPLCEADHLTEYREAGEPG